MSVLGNEKIFLKMKRIALLIFIGVSVFACNNPIDPVDPDPIDPRNNEDAKEISLRIHVPPKSVSTYAEEAASQLENRIDTILVILYQAGTPIDTSRFFGTTGPTRIDRTDDSTVTVSYEVDNITTGTLRAEVFANYANPKKIGPSPLNNEVPIPIATSPYNYFYMSGDSTLSLSGSAFRGEVHILRNVAKLRINVSKNSVVIPSDLVIDYRNIKIQIVNATDSTTKFANIPVDGPAGAGIGYLNYPERTSTALRRGAGFDDNPAPVGDGGTGNGGFIDSLYLYENLRTMGYPDATTTEIWITVPTLSAAGNTTALYKYPIETILTGKNVLRNHIYTLDLKVRGQDPTAYITLDVEPWDDVPMDGSILGTYLTLDKSEIEFDSSGEAIINFCTDAQAIYFDFEEFNQSNTAQLGGAIKAVGIDTSLTNTPGGFPLAPAGFKDAQIIVDQQHCGSFGFKLDLSAFPEFPNVNFSGKICIRAGNIVKCLTFPGRFAYDAHFIVGDPIFGGESFIKADVSTGAPWIEVSPNRLYTTTASSNYPLGGVGTGAAVPLYLHLDENLSTSNSPRTGSITLTTSTGVQKILNITQLPAINVGRFGYNGMSLVDDSIYTAFLYTEQIKEYGTTKPFYASSTSTPILPNNALYNGRYSPINLTQVFDNSNYINGFNYQSAVYEAINYCAYKNRHEPKTTDGALTVSDIKWYLPSQAQLMGMWITNEYYKDFATSNFVSIGTSSNTYPDIFWSSTHNPGHSPYPPTQAQYVDFRYGNVGHYERTQRNWVRCVRDGEAPSSSSQMIERDVVSGIELPQIYFHRGLPPSITSVTDKTYVEHNENDLENKEIYMQLRVAKYDLDGCALVPWAIDICDTYSHSDEAPSPSPGIWRLPTQRELQAIWVLQHEIKNLVPSFNLLDNEYYWSGTYAATTYNSGTSTYSSVWTVFGNGSRALIGGAGNTPHQLATAPPTTFLKVRCVLQY